MYLKSREKRKESEDMSASDEKKLSVPSSHVTIKVKSQVLEYILRVHVDLQPLDTTWINHH